MIKLSQERMKALLGIHGWSGVALGLLLYAVILTGAVSVFTDEIADWSAPLPEAAERTFPTGLDAPLRETFHSVAPEFRQDVVGFPLAGGRFLAYFHEDTTDADGRPITRGVEVDIDPTRKQVIATRRGTDEEIDAQRASNALAAFFVDLHVRLHLPHPWGLLLTGTLGLAMLVAAVTGLVVHRHLIKEMFTLRRQREALLRKRDLHVVAGTWNLPFAFILAFTGSFFSFAFVIGIPVVAMTSFGGDQEAVFEAMVGAPPKVDETPAPLADFDAMIADARVRSGGAEPYFFTLANGGRADALMSITTWPAPGELTGRTYRYDASTGAFLAVKPVIGLQPSAGSSLYALMGPLHFGNFSGIVSKAVWFALGFAGAYVTLTGLGLWTERRRAQRGWRHLARATVWFGYGLPLALLAAPYGFFPSFAADGDVHRGLWTAFFVAAALATGVSLAVRSLGRLRRLLLGGCAVLLAGLPLVRMLCGGPGWIAAFDDGHATVLCMDLGLIAAAGLCGWSAWREPGERREQDAAAVARPSRHAASDA